MVFSSSHNNMDTEGSLLAATEKAGGDGGVGEISGRIQKTYIDDIKNKRGKNQNQYRYLHFMCR